MIGNYKVEYYKNVAPTKTYYIDENLKYNNKNFHGITYGHILYYGEDSYYYNHEISGSYYFYSSGDSAITASYIHNRSLFISSFSVSAGILSFSVDTSSLNYKDYNFDIINLFINEFEK